MSAILDTVVDYEDKLVELVHKAQEPVADTVRRAADAAAERLPEVEYPAGVPTPFEVLETQVRFAKKLIDAQADLVKAVLEAAAPVAGYTVPAKVTRSTKAKSATRSAAKTAA